MSRYQWDIIVRLESMCTWEHDSHHCSSISSLLKSVSEKEALKVYFKKKTAFEVTELMAY